MTKSLQTIILVFIFGLSACFDQKEASPKTPAAETKIGQAFTKEELTNLVIATPSFLDGHLKSTGQMAEGATLLIFNDEYMWAIGEHSPINLHGDNRQTMFSWKIGDKGQVILRSMPIDIESPETCELWKTKDYPREFTKEGLPEKIDTFFDCGYPEYPFDRQTYRYPLPFYPRTMFGATTHWSKNPATTKATYRADLKIKRHDPMKPNQEAYQYDDYKSGNYPHSLTILQKQNDQTDEENKNRIVNKQRLFLFEHTSPQQGTLLHLYYNLMGKDFKLDYIYRIKNLTYNKMTDNYPDTFTEVSRSKQVWRRKKDGDGPLENAVPFND